MRAQSIASEPFGQMADLDDDDEEEGGKDALNTDDNEMGKTEVYGDDRGPDSKKSIESDIPSRKKSKEPKQLRDEVLTVYEEHDDSVYAAEWASDPWIFASLGYESRLVINKVPKAEKLNILF